MLLTMYKILLIFWLSMLSNTIFGIYYNVGVKKLKFNWKKILNTLLKAFVFTAGLTALSLVFQFLPNILLELDISLDKEILERYNIISIIFVLKDGTINYIAQSFDKYKKIVKGDGIGKT